MMCLVATPSTDNVGLWLAGLEIEALRYGETVRLEGLEDTATGLGFRR